MAKYEDNLEMLDGMSLLDLADMPERPALPTGTYQGVFGDFVTKMKEAEGDKPAQLAATITMQYIGTLELANSDEAGELENLKDGQELEFTFYLNNEYGQGALKKILRQLVTELGLDESAKMAAIREAMQDKPVCFSVSRRPAKNPTDTIKWNIDLRSITTASPTEVAAG